MRSIPASHRSTKKRSLRLATVSIFGAVAMVAGGSAIAPSPAEAQSAGLVNHCWIVADQSAGTGSDWLSDYDLITNVETIAGAGTSTFSVEAIAYHYPSSRLFATDAGQFGEISLATADYGEFLPIGPGALGDVDGLAFDSTTGVLWATNRTLGSDELIRIDPATGTQIGPTVTVAPTTYSGPLNSGGSTVLSDIDDLAINPVTGEFFAIANGAGTLDMLVVVDPITGATTPIGSPADSGVQDIEGLGFTPAGELIGTSGNGGGAVANSIVDINKTDGSASVRNDALTFDDHEAVDCLTNAYIDPSIGLEKATNGLDADTATGPFVGANGTVTWTYRITNNGNLPLFDLALTDDIEGAVTCAHPQPLFPGESTTCTLTAASVKTGQYANLGTITGTPIDLVGNGHVLDPETNQWLDPSGTPTDFTTFDPAANSPLPVVTSTDPSHYFGSVPQIDIEKATNGDDADTPTGPTITIGGPVNWTYTVTNPGNVAVSNVIVTDDNGTTDPADDIVPTYVSGDTNGDNLLDVDETWTYTATGTAVEGQSSNSATVNGTGPETTNPDGTTAPGTPVTDEDPSHHIGTPALVGAVSIEKDTNGVQADAEADNTPIGEGAAVTWTYVVTNTGALDLTNVTVTDDIEGPVCVIESLAIGESSTCTLSGIAGNTNYRNIGSVTAQPVDEEGNPTGSLVNDFDSSGYDVAVGPLVDVSVVKTIDGTIQAGGTGTYVLTIANLGPDTATNVTVVDVLPAGLTFSSATGDGWNCTHDAQTVTCTRASITVGEAVPPIRVTVAVGSTMGGKTIVNSATVSAAETDNVPENDQSTVSVLSTTLAAAPTQAAPTQAAPAQATANPTSRLPHTGSSTLALLLVATFMIATGSVMRLVPARRRND